MLVNPKSYPIEIGMSLLISAPNLKPNPMSNRFTPPFSLNVSTFNDSPSYSSSLFPKSPIPKHGPNSPNKANFSLKVCL